MQKLAPIDDDMLRESLKQESVRPVLRLPATEGSLRGQREIFNKMQREGTPVIVISLNSPYVLIDIPDARSCIYCYNYGDISMEALASVLFGKHKPAGRLPVSLPGLFPQDYSLTY